MDYHFCVLDNHLQMGLQVCLQGKKKLTNKRVTGFQVTVRMVSRTDYIPS